LAINSDREPVVGVNWCVNQWTCLGAFKSKSWGL